MTTDREVQKAIGELEQHARDRRKTIRFILTTTGPGSMLPITDD